MEFSNQNNLKSFIKNTIVKNIKKIKGKHAPIAEIAENTSYALSVKSIYNLKQKFKNFFLLIVKNYSKQPKFRYFLVIILANNSSDFLDKLARDYAVKNNLKLIQYSIYPKILRIQLLSLIEVKEIDDFNNSIEILTVFRKKFRDKLIKLKNLVQNE